MELLKELSESFGAPGFEDEIRAVVLREIKKLVDEVKIDALGNVIALKRAKVQANVRIKVQIINQLHLSSGRMGASEARAFRTQG